MFPHFVEPQSLFIGDQKFSPLSTFSKGPFCLLPLCSTTVVCPHFKWIATLFSATPPSPVPWPLGGCQQVIGTSGFPTCFLFFFHQLWGFHFRISSWVITREYTTSSPHHKIRWGCASTTLSGNLSLAKGMNFKSNVNQSSMIQHVSTIKKKGWLHHLVIETPWMRRATCLHANYPSTKEKQLSITNPLSDHPTLHAFTPCDCMEKLQPCNSTEQD